MDDVLDRVRPVYLCGALRRLLPFILVSILLRVEDHVPAVPDIDII